MAEILVDFEDKKEVVVSWIAQLSGVPLNNIRGADQSGKKVYPQVVINEVSEIDTHRPVRQVEEIDGELKFVIYASRQIMLDVGFITRDRDDFAINPDNRLLDARHYMTRFQGGLYLPELSIEFLSKNALSLLSAGSPFRFDEQKNDGWLRKHVIEIGIGYVAQSTEPVLTIDKITIARASVHIDETTVVDLEIVLTEYQVLEQKGQPNGYASLDSGGKVPESELPDITKIVIYEVSSEVDQLNLVVQQGDFCNRLDENKTYIALNSDNNSLADWKALLSPAGGVVSVDGQVGVVDLSAVYSAISHVHSALEVATSLGFTPEDSADKDQVNGYPSLDAGGKVPASQLPALALTDVYVVSSEAAQLALPVQEGDVAVRTDLVKSFIALNDVNASMSDWQELLNPTGGVQSVDSRSGVVTLGDLYKAAFSENTAFNRNFGSGAGEVAQGNLTVLLAGLQTVTGEKDFTDKIHVDNLTFDGDTISNNQTNGSVKLKPAGTGGVGNTDHMTGYEVRFSSGYDSEALDQQQTSFPLTLTLGGTWQSFTAAQTGRLTKVDFHLTTTTFFTSVRIYEGEGIAGNLLASTSGTFPSGWASAVFASPAFVESGQQYTIFFIPGGSNSNLGYINSNAYAGGRLLNNASWDLAFKTYVAPDAADLVFKKDSGEIGINKLNPTQALDIRGAVNVDESYRINDEEVLKKSGTLTDISGVKIDPASQKVSGMGVTEQDGNLYLKEDGRIIGTHLGTEDGVIRVQIEAGSNFWGFRIGTNNAAILTAIQFYVLPNTPSTSTTTGSIRNTGGFGNGGDLHNGGNLFIHTVKAGATQGAAGASTNEIWKTSGHPTLPDNVLMIGT